MGRMSETRPGLSEIEAMARDAVDALPAAFRPAAREVALREADRPDARMLQELGLRDPLALTGLYDGIPMTEKSVADQPLGPDTVWLFREPILAEWHARADVTLQELVTHVTVHEFAHHFGWSDADIALIDRWWE